MKVNCKALKISILISCIFFIFSITFKVIDMKFCNNFTGFMKDIVLGIFCSAVVTIFFYSSAYNVEKKKLLEQYWNEIRKTMIEFRKIEYMNIKFESNLLIGFINEKSNSWKKEYYKSLGQELPEKEIINTNLIKSEIRKRNLDLFEKISEEAGINFLNEEVDKIYDRTLIDIDKRVDQYINYINYSIDNLNFILGDMEFFTGKKNYIKAYNLYRKIFDLRRKIQEEVMHFRYYKEGKGNKMIILSKILELQKYIFKVDENEDEKTVYTEFSDIMEKELEEFRAKIIYNIEPEKVERIPLFKIKK